MSDLLTVRGLRLGFGKTEVVHGVDLQVLEGPYGLGVIGESGSGKTTIGRAVLRLHPALAGSITYRERDVLTMERVELSAYRREVQLVFQDGGTGWPPGARCRAVS
jgi:ABC-type oligopeptide transport system ATPase subunit